MLNLNIVNEFNTKMETLLGNTSPEFWSVADFTYLTIGRVAYQLCIDGEPDVLPDELIVDDLGSSLVFIYICTAYEEQIPIGHIWLNYRTKTWGLVD